ncbi:MAG TPA: TrkA family potassium uptake protein [Clostridia bacterium]|nr:TrkA family potassium uptake protein [Clostridia bacterium]
MRVIIVGCGRIGSGLAQALDRSGHSVTIIDLAPEAFDKLPQSFGGKKVVGVGFDRDILILAGIEKTDAVVSVTSSDETNAVIARLASRFFRVPKVVARLYDRRKADIYKRFGVQTVDTTTWGVERVIHMISYAELDTMLSLGRGVDIMQVEVPQLLVGRKVNELAVPNEIQVAAIARDNQSFVPTLGTEFRKGDTVTLSVATSSVPRLKRLLGLA